MCVEFLWKSERYELIADVNKPIIAVFEKQRDFKVCVLYPLELADDLQHSKVKTFSFYIGIVLTNPSGLWFQKLSDLYYDIHRSYLKVAEVVNSEKRLFGRYYRVAFYGQVSTLEVTQSEHCIHCCPPFFIRHLTTYTSGPVSELM